MPTGTDVAPYQPNFFEQYGEETSGLNIIGKLMKFTKYGEYKAGQDEEDIPLGTQMIFDMRSLRVGWVKWRDNKPVEQLMGLVSEGHRTERREDLGDLDKELWETFEDGREKDPWVLTSQVIALNPENGELYTFSVSSDGGRKAISEITKVYGKHVRMHPAEMPQVELQMTEYKHPEYGKIRKPLLPIKGWIEPPTELTEATPTRDEDEAEVEAVRPAPRLVSPAKPAAKANGRPTLDLKANKTAPAKAPVRALPKPAAPAGKSGKPAVKAAAPAGKAAGKKGVRF